MTVRTDWPARWQLLVDGEELPEIGGKYTTTGALLEALGRVGHDREHGEILEVTDHYAAVDLDDEFGSLLEIQRVELPAEGRGSDWDARPGLSERFAAAKRRQAEAGERLAALVDAAREEQQ